MMDLLRFGKHGLTHLSTHFENWPMHVFKIYTTPIRQRTIISAGMQDTSLPLFLSARQ
jgi:hypothetical protein